MIQKLLPGAKGGSQIQARGFSGSQEGDTVPADQVAFGERAPWEELDAETLKLVVGQLTRAVNQSRADNLQEMLQNRATPPQVQELARRQLDELESHKRVLAQVEASPSDKERAARFIARKATPQDIVATLLAPEATQEMVAHGLRALQELDARDRAPLVANLLTRRCQHEAGTGGIPYLAANLLSSWKCTEYLGDILNHAANEPRHLKAAIMHNFMTRDYGAEEVGGEPTVEKLASGFTAALQRNPHLARAVPYCWANIIHDLKYDDRDDHVRENADRLYFHVRMWEAEPNAFQVDPKTWRPAEPPQWNIADPHR